MQRVIIILLLCSLLLILFFFYQTIRVNELNQRNTDAQYLANYQNTMDTAISFTTQSLWQITQEPSFFEYSIADAKSINYYMLLMQSSLTQKLSLFDNYCYTIGILREDYPVVLTDRASASVEDFLNEIQFSDEQYRRALTLLKETNNGTYIFVPMDGENTSPYLTLTSRYSYHQGPDVYIFVSLYKDYFHPQTQDSKNFFLIADNKIMSRNLQFSEEAEAEVLETVDSIIQEQENLQPLYIKTVKSATYLVAPSDKLNCYYVMTTYLPAGEIALKITLLSIMAAIGIFVLILVIRTRTMTKPIAQTVKALQPYYKNSSENEFSFISEATSVIIEKNAGLVKNLSTKNDALKDHFIVELLLGILTEKEIELSMEEFGLQELYQPTVVVIIDFYDSELSGSLHFDLSLLKQDVATITKQKYPKVTLKDAVSFKAKYVLLFNQTPQSVLVKLLDALIAGWNRTTELKAVASIGTVANDPSDLKGSFNIALNLLEYKFAIKSKNVLTPDHLHTLENSMLYYPLDIENTLINYTISLHRTKVHLLLDELFEKNAKAILLPNLFSEFVQALVSTIRRCLQITNFTVDDVYEEGAILYLELKMCESAEAFREKTLFFFDRLMDCLEQFVAKQNKLTSASFVSYIEKNFNRDLSLEEVAEHFQYSVPYISKTIKNLTGYNFKKYLNKFRIDVAMKLLTEEPDLKIKDLAERVGFSNSNSFIRVFKATAGMSPNEYREQYHIKGMPPDC